MQYRKSEDKWVQIRPHQQTAMDYEKRKTPDLGQEIRITMGSMNIAKNFRKWWKNGEQ